MRDCVGCRYSAVTRSRSLRDSWATESIGSPDPEPLNFSPHPPIHACISCSTLLHPSPPSQVVEISLAQMDNLCGNALELQSSKGLPVMAMSTQVSGGGRGAGGCVGRVGAGVRGVRAGDRGKEGWLGRAIGRRWEAGGRGRRKGGLQSGTGSHVHAVRAVKARGRALKAFTVDQGRRFSCPSHPLPPPPSGLPCLH